MLLGEPEYWAPGDFATYDHDGKLQRIGEQVRNHANVPTSLMT